MTIVQGLGVCLKCPRRSHPCQVGRRYATRCEALRAIEASPATRDLIEIGVPENADRAGPDVLTDHG